MGWETEKVVPQSHSLIGVQYHTTERKLFQKKYFPGEDPQVIISSCNTDPYISLWVSE